MSIETNFGRAYFDKMPTVAQTLVDVVRFFGCERMYGVPGDYAAPLVLAFDEAVALSPASNEQNAAYAACGQAEVDGIGFCLATYMVGSLPCLSAAALAKAERLAVVFITGAPGEREARDEVLHHTLVRSDAWQRGDDNALEAFRALGLRAERLTGQKNPYQANIAGEHFFRLVAHAYMYREPVMIEVPRDLLGTRTQTISLPSSPDGLRPPGVELAGLPEILAHTRQRLLAAQAPVLYFGEKVKNNARVQALIVDVCHRLHIPYVANIYAKGILDDDDPLSLGVYNGVFSRPATRRYIESTVDLVIEVGTSTFAQDVSNALNTGTNRLTDFPHKIAVIGSRPLECDELAFLEGLAAIEVPAKAFVAPAPDADPEPFPDDEPTSLRSVFTTLDRVAHASPRPLVFLPEVGSAFFASFHLPTRRSNLGRSWLANPWYGAMGTALPYARAAAHAIASRQANDVPVVLIGDGGFQFQCSELGHLVRDGLDVLIVHLSNGTFAFGRCSDSPIYACVDPRFDVVALATAYGARGVRVDTIGALHRALDEYVRVPLGVLVIDVPVPVDDTTHGDDVLAIFNTYIQARAGIESASKRWAELVRGDA